ncbi:Squidulin [Phytophthora citrophthora]|uniref:Squidulin n=1 Tax=Phytophthora citrophthora TaxID=4793 RepID=A0AAD9GIL7_9STRA|nr:Squidulin [Phytophthora citrophthora]
MPASLQRNNFRCAIDGSNSPKNISSMSPGVAAMGSPGSPVKSRAEFPSRQRKRLQVGTTNLSKGNPFNEVYSQPSPTLPDPSITAAATRISETNVAAIRSSLESPLSRDPNTRSSGSGKAMPLVLRTEVRRLSSPTPASCSRSTEEHREFSEMPPLNQAINKTTPAERPSLQVGNNVQEDSISRSGNPVANHPAGNTPQLNSSSNKRKILLAHNRAKLYDVFMEKYGSMRAVFRAFDNDGNGMISAQRFHDMVEAAEVDLTPDETRALYKTADINGDNTVAFQEFVQMFSPCAGNAHASAISAFSPVQERSGMHDPSSSMAIKYRTPLELSPRSRRRMNQLRKQVTNELCHKHGTAIGVRGGKPEQLLAYAFKNVDSDNDGFLSYSEVEYALGRGYLQMQDAIPTSEMREMLQLMDRNGDEQISLREFVHYFAVGERDVATNLTDNARNKELAALHVKRTVDLTPRDEVDPIFAQRKNVMLQKEESPASPNNREISPGTCLPEQLNKRTAAILASSNTITSPTRKGKSQDDKPSLSSAQSSLQLEIDRRPASSCGPVGPIVAVLSPVSPDRFYHRRNERTDWGRIGVGGNGTSTDTGLYLSPQERFVTTSHEAYSPLHRAPPSAKTDEVNDSFLLMRAGKPSTTMEEDTRRARRTARFERTQMLAQEFEDSHAQAERLKDWKSRANIRKAADERFGYLDRLQEREHRITAREDHMQRRHGGASFLRMWAGSAESQFNSHDS